MNNRTGRIIGGIAFLAFGIGWALELAGIIDINFQGWWTAFIIIPCFAALFTDKQKGGPLVGLGIGILLLLATRGNILWVDIWKYIVCLVAVVWGLTMIIGHGNCRSSKASACNAVDNLKQVDEAGRQVRRINVSFGKQVYDFGGRRFDGADVQTSFGFTALDLRNADILDGAVITVNCSFGGMEIRVGNDVCVRTDVESSFAGVESQCESQPVDGRKMLYVKGHCSFGGIEIK